MKRLSPSRRFVRAMLALFAIVLLGGGGVIYWKTSQSTRSTDNAYVGADIASIPTQLSGPVVAVPVPEGAYVRAGDPLFDVDPHPFQVALLEAEAKLAQAQQATRAGGSDVEAARAALARSEADADNVRAQARRAHDLVAAKFLSRQAED